MIVQRIGLGIAIASSLAVVAMGCPGGGPREGGDRSSGQGDANTAPSNTDPSNADPSADEESEDGSHPSPEPGGDFAGQEGQVDQPVHQDKTFRVVVEATFTDLPEGAIVVAPSARDRRYQKVTKSDHQGLPGSVMPTEEGDNLFYVSDPVAAGGGELKYTGTFEVTRRVGTQGDVGASKGAAYDAGMGEVKGASTDAAIVAAAKALGDKLEPYDALMRAVDRAASLKVDDVGGTDTVAEVLAGKPASRLGVAATTAELLRVAGVPARLIQGLHQPDLPGMVNKAHAWLDAEMPRLGWVPVDPVLRREAGGELAGKEMQYVGFIPSDRITFVIGSTAVIPAEAGIVPRLELTGQLGHPFALKDGQRVGKVTWSARFEALEAAPGDK